MAAQFALGSAAGRRHNLDARQMGIPLVCGLGSGFSLHSLGGGRYRLCQKATAAAAQGALYAPQRPTARLRMELRRREPAGTRRSCLGYLQHGPRGDRQGRHGVSGAGFP